MTNSGRGSRIAVNRQLVGVLALVCLASSLVIWMTGPHNESWLLWRAGFMRVGLVMSAFWLALPSRKREAAWANVSPWTFVGLLLAVFAAARYPRAVVPIVIVVIVVGFFLRPREKKRPKMRPPGAA